MQVQGAVRDSIESHNVINKKESVKAQLQVQSVQEPEEAEEREESKQAEETEESQQTRESEEAQDTEVTETAQETEGSVVKERAQEEVGEPAVQDEAVAEHFRRAEGKEGDPESTPGPSQPVTMETGDEDEGTIASVTPDEPTSDGGTDAAERTVDTSADKEAATGDSPPTKPKTSPQKGNKGGPVIFDLRVRQNEVIDCYDDVIVSHVNLT